MYYSKLTGGFYDTDIHGDKIPSDAVEITEDQYLNILNGQSSGKIIISDSSGNPMLSDPLPLSLDQLKEQKINQLELSRNNAIQQDVLSDALGSAHIYAAKPSNRQFLNDLVTLGNGGNFTCTDASGIKARKLHTATQLMQVAIDFKAVIEEKFDHFDGLVIAVNDASTQSQIDAINW